MSEPDQLRRIGVIGDVHCETDALTRSLDALEHKDVDVVMCVGDLIDGIGDADLTLQILRDHGVECVAGNHERWFLANEMRDLRNATQTLGEKSVSFLQSLERIRMFETVKGRMMLCHGVGEDDEAWLRPSTRGFGLQQIWSLRDLMLDDALVFMIGGHSHERMVREFAGLTVINAGTLHRDYDPCFVVVDFGSLTVEFFSAEESSSGALMESVPLPVPKPAGATT